MGLLLVGIEQAGPLAHAVCCQAGEAGDAADSNYLEAYRAVLRAVLSLARTRHAIDILIDGARVQFRCQW